LTLLDEKYSEKIDWVKVCRRLWHSLTIKLGFQGKSPDTDFRATGKLLAFYHLTDSAGVLGLTQLHSFCTTYPVLAQRIIHESGSSAPLDITEPWYPFALLGIHMTNAILNTLSSGFLQETIIMKIQGNAFNSVSRFCQDLYGTVVLIFKSD